MFSQIQQERNENTKPTEGIITSLHHANKWSVTSKTTYLLKLDSIMTISMERQLRASGKLLRR